MKIGDGLFLKQRQSLPLDAKILMSKKRCKEWAEHWDDEVFIAFSGGKDSVVLAHLVRSVLGESVPCVFYDTGLEYPEVKEIVYATPNHVIRRPKLTYRQVIEKYGYCVVSKQASHSLAFLQRPSDKNIASRKYAITGEKIDGTFVKPPLAKKWRFLANAPFRISDMCCDVLKKKPAMEFSKESGKYPFLGTLANESRLRTLAYVKNGCNAFHTKHPTSTPIAFWTEQDVLEYIVRYGLKIADVYGEIKRNENGKLYTTGEQRTGCVWCMFGAQYKGPDGLNRFQRLFKTHPKIHKYCIDQMGLGAVLDYVGVPYLPPVSKQDLVQIQPLLFGEEN